MLGLALCFVSLAVWNCFFGQNGPPEGPEFVALPPQASSLLSAALLRVFPEGLSKYTAHFLQILVFGSRFCVSADSTSTPRKASPSKLFMMLVDYSKD